VNSHQSVVHVLSGASCGVLYWHAVIKQFPFC